MRSRCNAKRADLEGLVTSNGNEPAAVARLYAVLGYKNAFIMGTATMKAEAWPTLWHIVVESAPRSRASASPMWSTHGCFCAMLFRHTRHLVCNQRKSLQPSLFFFLCSLHEQ